jgi:iron complex outermembrane receptor protein
VTGERRTENLATTPITASVLNAEDIQNRDIFNVNALQFIAPSVTVNDLGQGIDFNIRGIGKAEHNTQSPAGVVTYRDGVATFPGYFTEEPYFDVKSVEVYRGPQGTFVGQNATGGAVFVTTNDPEIGGGFGGYGLLQYGNYNDVQAQGAINIPLASSLALRLSLFGESRDSFYTITDSDPADNCPNHKYVGCKPGYNAADWTWGVGRASLLWKPTEALTISLKFDADYLDYGAAPAAPWSELLPVGTPIPTAYGINAPNPHHSDLFHLTANAPMARLDRATRTVLKIDYVFPNGMTLRSISDYNNGNGNWTMDLDGTDYGNPSLTPFFGTTNNWMLFDRVDETIYSQEFNLISADNQRVTWVVGLYGQSNLYGWIKPYQWWLSVGPRFPNPTPSASNFYQYGSLTFEGETSNTTYAAFGQIEGKLGGGVSVSLGGRWSETRSKNTGPLWSYGTPLSMNAGQKSYNFSYKGAIDWEVNEGNYLYAFVATGYKGGGLNTPITATFTPPPFKSETNIDYETGWKATSWFDGHLRTSVDAFYTVYNNFQAVLADAMAPTRSYEVNVPKASTVYGIEADAQASFGQLSFTGNIGLIHTELGTLWAIDTRRGTNINPCDPLTGAGGNPYCIDVTGHPQPYAPAVTYSLSAQYEFVLDNGDTLTPRANFAYVSGQWGSMFQDAARGDLLGVRALLGAQLEWKRGTWLFTLYGNNVLDQHYATSNNSGLLFAGAPRQFGVRLLKMW